MARHIPSATPGASARVTQWSLPSPESDACFATAPLTTLDVHCAVGGIAQPNPASVALHEKLGFENIGRFREIGRKFGRWIDVGYWALRLT